MAKRLFEVEAGLSDGKIVYLSGNGIPGSTDATNDAPISSQYTDISTSLTYQKRSEGSGVGVWQLTISQASNTRNRISQVGHGLVVGNWLYKTASNGYALAQADSTDTSDVIGIVDEVYNENEFSIVTHGYTNISFVAQEGSAIFLSQTVAGGGSTVKPSTQVHKAIGFIVDTKVFVNINNTILLGEHGSPVIPYIILDNVVALGTIDTIVVTEHTSMLWLLEVESSSGRYSTMIHATHDGFNGVDATEAGWQEFARLELGTNIAGLALGFTLSGTGAGQLLKLEVLASPSVNVRARRIAA